MPPLSDNQSRDLKQLNSVAAEFGAELAIIGATALRCFFDPERFTVDLDFGVALDLEDFSSFAKKLKTLGWTQEVSREHRWLGPHASRSSI